MLSLPINFNGNKHYDLICVWPCIISVGRARSESGGIRWRTGGEVKGKLANGVGSQYSHATSERGISSITKADAHTSAASIRLNWRPHRFEWTRPFRGKTKPGFCACAIMFRMSYTCFLYIGQVVANKCQRFFFMEIILKLIWQLLISSLIQVNEGKRFWSLHIGITYYLECATVSQQWLRCFGNVQLARVCDQHINLISSCVTFGFGIVE